MKALVIPELDPVFEVDLVTGSDGSRLKQLQDLVGGIIEAVPVEAPETTCYVHGEGKFVHGLNPRATLLLTRVFPTLFDDPDHHDYIAGPAVLVGFLPARGDDPVTGGHSDLPAEVAQAVWNLPHATERIEVLS